jgi:hypothetical protein
MNPLAANPTLADPTSLRTEGPTPAGGAYAIGYFRDAAGNPCPMAQARQVEAIEYDASGKVIARTYLTTGGAAK